MDTAHADALSARSRLDTRGWIPARNESFRHLPPPGADTWLGSAAPSDQVALAGTGWSLQCSSHTLHDAVQAQWLDASEPAQRAALFAGLELPDTGDAAPFAWAHRALCRQGLRLSVGPADRSQTVWLQLQHQATSAVEAPLLVVEVADGVRCVLVETHASAPTTDATGLTQNLHIQIQLGQGASLQHLRISTPAPQDHIAHHVHAQLCAQAHYHQALIASASAYHLQRSHLLLDCAHTSARTAGLLFAADAAMEQQVQTAHNAAHTHSHVEALVLGSGRAHAVVNAHTRIAPGADEANVHQRLSGIPLAGQPRLILRPHLEIHHDKVQAAHGATWGALPEDALFYARQRGLDEASARALIIEGMATALLERCFDDPATLAAATQDGLLARTIAQHLDAGQTPRLAATKEPHHG